MAATAIHRTTLEVRISPSSADVPEPTWKHDPDMSAVAGVPRKYWKWDAILERPTEMNVAEKAAVDAAEAQAQEDADLGPIDAKTLIQAFALVLIDELNAHASAVTGILNASDTANNMAQFQASVALIADLPQRTKAQVRSAIVNKYRSLT